KGQGHDRHWLCAFNPLQFCGIVICCAGQAFSTGGGYFDAGKQPYPHRTCGLVNLVQSKENETILTVVMFGLDGHHTCPHCRRILLCHRFVKKRYERYSDSYWFEYPARRWLSGSVFLACAFGPV